ncbi:MAG: 3-oxoacyl-[acyl-carrier protein] reductase [Chloroflexi bacterium]|jgi:3-oxoacyl-[acyl-carrier protein] reductase|nr:MAG: 3-oxoacyl-[acyl-carrier protein] reductase [Chloroflexota bacterium]
MKDNSEMNDRYALVTGAAKGIGKSCVLHLAKMGINVAINYRSSKKEAELLLKEIEAIGVKGLIVKANVSDLNEVKNMTKSILCHFPRIDILVNNAGIIDDTLIVRMKDENWKPVIDTNLNGTFYCTREFIREMMSNRWGRIINIGSIVGSRGNAGQSNYSTSKAGIIGFTKSLAKELAARNITANVIEPGYIDTDTVAVLGDKFKGTIKGKIPMGYLGTPDDLGPIVAFIASDQARYITGQVIAVDGGLAV